MKLFNHDGYMIIPDPVKKEAGKSEKVLAVKECFCQNGHSLIKSRAQFNGHAGIMLKVKLDSLEGLVAISPIFGEKSRISIDIDLKKDDLLSLCCPECGEPLPVFSPCNCGGELIALFNTKKADFANCIGVCNRVDCPNAVTKNEGELLSISMIDSM
ncbi:MAG: hypothetical protein GY754_42290 [bacterium]|nr:hypothetical protein [bacterium]